jgi:hypothetical protein
LRFGQAVTSVATSGEVVVGPSWIPTPTPATPFLAMFAFLFSSRDFIHMLAIGMGAAVLIGGIIFAARQSGWLEKLRHFPVSLLGDLRTDFGPLLLLACWLVIPVLVPIILSMFISPIYLHRYVIPAAPALYLLIGWILYQLRHVSLAGASTLAISLVLLLSLPDYYSIHNKENWRAAADHVAANIQPGDLLVFSDHKYPDTLFVVSSDDGWPVGSQIVYLHDLFHYYYRGEQPACYMEVALDDSTSVDAFRTCVSEEVERVWVVFHTIDYQYVEDFQTAFPQALDIVTLQENMSSDFNGVYTYLFDIPDANVEVSIARGR